MDHRAHQLRFRHVCPSGYLKTRPHPTNVKRHTKTQNNKQTHTKQILHSRIHITETWTALTSATSLTPVACTSMFPIPNNPGGRDTSHARSPASKSERPFWTWSPASLSPKPLRTRTHK